MQIALQTFIHKVDPSLSPPFCIVAQLSFLYRLVIRIVLFFSLTAYLLWQYFLRYLLLFLEWLSSHFFLFSCTSFFFRQRCLICTPFLTRVPGLTVVTSLSYPLYSACSLDTWSSDCLFSFGSVFSCTFHFYHPSRSLYFSNKPTFIFLCKVSASGVLQGSPLGLPRDFFQVFGVRLLLIQKLHGQRWKK